MTNHNNDVAIEVSELNVDIGSKRLLSDISFIARAGEVTGLIGPNGAGKSTLLAALSGDIAVSSGTMSVGGIDPTRSDAKTMARHRAVLLQDVYVSFEFLVRDVVAMGRRPWRDEVDKTRDDRIIDAALEATDTASLAARDIVTLSGGERARVALARVLAQQTPIIFLDEPTAALDIRHQEQVLSLVREIVHATGTAVVVVLHDLNAAAAYCDHIICLSGGRIVADGLVRDVYTNETLSSVYGWPVEVTHSADGLTSVRPRRRDPPKLAETLLTQYQFSSTHEE
ncbi:heme ABC transporter ATP-binding protein [Corynebacterium auriscanis]|uniref:heme ABC transporter ATP-binding protein n=1 Tax=Corynebacterium auriscanis TaxID=99807 RepID=UPI003CF63074